MKIAFCEVRGLLNDLNDKLSGENGDRWRDRLTSMLRESTFPIWRKLQIGVVRSARLFYGLLVGGGFYFGSHTRLVLNKVKPGKVQVVLGLVVVNVAELGFAKGATFAQIVDQARKAGLELCPSEVGPALRLDYKKQPAGEWLRIAMEPIVVAGGLNVFYLGHGDDGELFFSAFWFLSEDIFDAASLWVFVRKS